MKQLQLQDTDWKENLKSLETYDERVLLAELLNNAGDAFQGCYNQSVGGGNTRKSAQGESPHKKLERPVPRYAKLPVIH